MLLKDMAELSNRYLEFHPALHPVPCIKYIFLQSIPGLSLSLKRSRILYFFSCPDCIFVKVKHNCMLHRLENIYFAVVLASVYCNNLSNLLNSCFPAIKQVKVFKDHVRRILQKRRQSKTFIASSTVVNLGFFERLLCGHTSGSFWLGIFSIGLPTAHGSCIAICVISLTEEFLYFPFPQNASATIAAVT